MSKLTPTNELVVTLTTDELKMIIERTLKEIIKNQFKEKEKEYLSYAEAAQLLAVKPNTIAQRVKNGTYTKYLQKGSNKPYLKKKEILNNFQ